MRASWEENSAFAQEWSERFAAAQNDCVFLAAKYLKSSATHMDKAGHILKQDAQKLLRIHDLEDLNKVLDNCSDPWLLCVAVWLGCKKLAEQKDTISVGENACQGRRMALILARAALLFTQNGVPFQGEVQTMRLVSNKEFTFPWENAHQELSLSRNGHGTFWTTTAHIPWNSVSDRHEQAILLSPSAAQEMLNEIAAVFSGDWEPDYFSDDGTWELELTNAQGKTYRFSYSLYSDSEALMRLSNLMRERLGNGELIAFDGERQPAHILCRITLERKDALEKTGTKANLAGEKLTLERAAGSVEWCRQTAYQGSCCCRYTSVPEVAALLDLLSYPEIFRQPALPEKEFLDVYGSVPVYTLRVEYQDGMQQILQGCYDKSELPEFFSNVMANICSLLRRLEHGCMMDPKEYGKERLRKGRLIYCSVAFEHTDKTYYYRTQDTSLCKGDVVVVPAGRNNREALAEIVKIEHFAPEEVPFPIEQTKSILRRYTGEVL